MKYRKKPVVIEAVEFRKEGDGGHGDIGPICRFLGHVPRIEFTDFPRGSVAAVFIQTLEGEMRADPGDWIIRGVKGEFYPCKPDIFAATYEPAE